MCCLQRILVDSKKAQKVRRMIVCCSSAVRARFGTIFYFFYKFDLNYKNRNVVRIENGRQRVLLHAVRIHSYSYWDYFNDIILILAIMSS